MPINNMKIHSFCMFPTSANNSQESMSTMIDADNCTMCSLVAWGRRQQKLKLCNFCVLDFMELIDMRVFVQYERQLAENQEKSSRLQRRLTQAEQRATTATQQVWVTTERSGDMVRLLHGEICVFPVLLLSDWTMKLFITCISFLQLSMLASQRRKMAAVDPETLWCLLVTV